MHTEVCETSKKSVLQELEAARTDLARLSAQSARSIGLEQRLAAALQEKDDLHQELDSATQRARMAEMRIVSYRDKCGADSCRLLFEAATNTSRYSQTASSGCAFER